MPVFRSTCGKHLMSSILIYTLLSTVLGSMGVQAAPGPVDDRFYDKEYARDVAEWLAEMAMQQPNLPEMTMNPRHNPCRTNSPNYDSYFTSPISANKRNSELINSLLSLPKTLNDAGKK